VPEHTTQNPQYQAIEIRVDEIAQLFNTLDPFPFKERDLDSDAEEYIVGWARELPQDHPLHVLIHLPVKEAESKSAQELEEALGRFVAYRADVLGRDLNELFRIGRRSLLIGLSVLGLCLTAERVVSGRLDPDYLGRFIEEGLIIVGWVANWRPIEIFLYDWWPLARRRDLYRRLAKAAVILNPVQDPKGDRRSDEKAQGKPAQGPGCSTVQLSGTSTAAP
jgi:hypothetical protein